MRLPIASKTGRAFSKASASPPTIIVSVPSIAPFCPPETGASSQNNPLDSASAASSCVTLGEIVDISMIIVPGFAVAKIPFSPCATAMTSGESVTIVMTTSQAAATSAAVFTARTLPSDLLSAVNFPAFPGVRVATVRANPALSKFCACGAPIIPRPIKPTCIKTLPKITPSRQLRVQYREP